MSSIDSLVCHNVDHIEVMATEGGYDVEIHCTCGKSAIVDKKAWEAIIERVKTAASEVAEEDVEK